MYVTVSDYSTVPQTPDYMPLAQLSAFLRVYEARHTCWLAPCRPTDDVRQDFDCLRSFTLADVEHG